MADRALVSIVVISWNSVAYLERCLDSLRQQTYPHVELIVVDNASRDGSAEVVAERFPEARLVKNTDNQGFCRAFNQGAKLSSGKYVMAVNPDVFMTATFLDELVRVAESDELVGSVTGKLLKAEAQETQSSDRAILDSTGLFIDRRRRTYDRGQWEVDEGQYDSSTEVFSACGAAPLYRRSMLEDVALDGQYFDEDFFAYYEDADLGWRARLLGWKCRYAPRAVAYHVRAGRDTLSSALRHRPGQIHAVKNRYLMLVKNDLAAHFLLDLPLILVNEIPRLLYILLLAPSLAKGLLGFFRLLRPMLRKRKAIQERKVIPSSRMREWLTQSAC